jgi:hypothetical protein
MLGNAVSGVKWLVLLQLLTRVFTFVLNALVLRQVSSEVFGVAAQLQVITNLTLFFSREAVRRAIVRGGSQRLAWLSLLPLGVMSCAVVGWVWLRNASAAELAVPHFETSVLLTLVATMVELTGEAAYARNLAAMRYRARFAIESAGVVAMCVALFVSVTFFSLGLLSWAIGQLAFAIVSATGNVVVSAASEKKKDEEPSKQIGLGLLLAFQWQATQQVLLQEGERILLKLSASSLSNQGLYAVVANLGSLLVRTLFLPLEDVACTYFSRLLLSQQGEKSRKELAAVLRIILHLLSLISLLIVTLGPPLSFFGLDLLYGSRISDSEAPAILRAYCV